MFFCLFASIILFPDEVAVDVVKSKKIRIFPLLFYCERQRGANFMCEQCGVPKINSFFF